MIFAILLCITALLGSGIGAALSCVPGKRGRGWLRGLLLLPLSLGLFAAGLCLVSRTTDLTAAVNRWFPDRLSKLFGCGLLLALCSVLGVLLGVVRAKGLRAWFRGASGSRIHRFAVLALFAGGAAAVLGCTVLAGDPPPTPLRLNEVCCGNFSLLRDPDTGEYEDYIELINTGSESVNLDGYYLSDNGKKRNRFRLPAMNLDPGASVVLWPDGTGKSGKKSGEGIHLNFKLREGDTLWFSSPYGVVLDHVTVPKPEKNVSLSRVAGSWTLAVGTPGWSNEEAELRPAPRLTPPRFSLASGFYDEPQTLTISADPGCEIYYTLDGAVPTEKSLRYEGPLTLEDISDRPNRVLNHPTTTLDRSGVVTEPVDKGTLIRAAAIDENGARSETVTEVYFVGKDTFEKYRGRQVLNIVAAPVDLFGNYGIAVTGVDYDRWLKNGGTGNSPFPFFYRRGRLVEKDAEIFFWDEAHSLRLDQACGIRLQGDSSRAAAFKRFRLVSRKIYSGSYSFNVPLFGDLPSHSFFTRQDSADVVAQMLFSDLGLGGLDATPAAVFINGEFYYDSYLRERYDKQYFETHFGVDREDLVVISNDELDRGTKEDYADYQALMEDIYGSDCGDPEVYARICEKMDVENYARYVAVNIYCNNTDWSMYKNYKLWRSRKASDDGFRDGRWRWLLYDMDGCVWSAEKYGAHKAEFDAFEIPQPYTKVPFVEMPLFSDLLENEEFRQLFARTWLELTNTLTPARGQAVLDRYGVTQDYFWISFLTNRPAYAPGILSRELGLSGERAALRLSLSEAEGGAVRMETGGLEFTDGSWEGTWITGVPLKLKAEPAPGWRFVRWEGAAAGTEPEITLTPAGDTALTAVFEKN